MKPISIFYHAYLSGGTIPVNPDNVRRIICEQFEALKLSDLLKSATNMTIGVAGTEFEECWVSELFREKGETFLSKGSGELPTMRVMHRFCHNNPDHLICYFHTKGAIHNGNATYEAWRRCMERSVIHNWRKCVKDLERGYDTVGSHWLTPSKYSFIGPVPYWGGNFFWARAKFLTELPAIDINADRYQAEVWIGKSKRKPNVIDYAQHFPMSGCTP